MLLLAGNRNVLVFDYRPYISNVPCILLDKWSITKTQVRAVFAYSTNIAYQPSLLVAWRLSWCLVDIIYDHKPIRSIQYLRNGLKWPATFKAKSNLRPSIYPRGIHPVSTTSIRHNFSEERMATVCGAICSGYWWMENL